MRIRSTDPIEPISPITPIKRRRQVRVRSKKREVITDLNLGRNIDISVMGPLKAPYCFDCSFYFVTWNSSFPHGCNKFEFKTRNSLPSMRVYEANKSHCPFFEENPKVRG